MSFCLYGFFAHLVPMLTDRGMQTGEAAMVASTVGVTILIARVVIGYLIDRFFAPYISMICFMAA